MKVGWGLDIPKLKNGIADSARERRSVINKCLRGHLSGDRFVENNELMSRGCALQSRARPGQRGSLGPVVG
jgi:hypothetical protein